jgi:hypothetical protein
MEDLSISPFGTRNIFYRKIDTERDGSVLLDPGVQAFEVALAAAILIQLVYSIWRYAHESYSGNVPFAASTSPAR